MSMLALAIAASTIKPDDVAPGILLYGPSGAGKTHAAVEGGKPLVLLMERNGLTTILRANPQAGVILVEDRMKPDGKGGFETDANGQPAVLKALDVVRGVIAECKAGLLQKAGYDRLVIDSATELQRLFKDEIIGGKNKDDGEDMSLKDWGTLAEKMRRFLRTVRALPAPVVMTALVEETQDEAGTIHVRPSFEGKKTANEIAQYFSALGFVAKRVTTEGEGDKAKQTVVHRVMFDGPARYMTKSCGPVSGILAPNITGWIASISTAQAQSAPPSKTEAA